MRFHQGLLFFPKVFLSSAFVTMMWKKAINSGIMLYLQSVSLHINVVDFSTFLANVQICLTAILSPSSPARHVSYWLCFHDLSIQIASRRNFLWISSGTFSHADHGFMFFRKGTGKVRRAFLITLKHSVQKASRAQHCLSPADPSGLRLALPGFPVEKLPFCISLCCSSEYSTVCKRGV